MIYVNRIQHKGKAQTSPGCVFSLLFTGSTFKHKSHISNQGSISLNKSIRYNIIHIILMSCYSCNKPVVHLLFITQSWKSTITLKETGNWRYTMIHPFFYIENMTIWQEGFLPTTSWWFQAI